MQDRDTFVLSIAQHRIPKSTVAALAGVPNAKVSEFVRGHNLTDENRLKIEHAISDLVDVINVMQDLVSLRPDMRDVPSLRTVIGELRGIRQNAEMQSDMEKLKSEVLTGLAAL